MKKKASIMLVILIALMLLSSIGIITGILVAIISCANTTSRLIE